MSWEVKLSEIIEKVSPYAFGSSKVVDPEEMDNVCRYVVQFVEDTMLKCAQYMHWQGVLAGLEAAKADTSEMEKDPSLDKFFSERKFREWERLEREGASNATGAIHEEGSGSGA